MKIAHCQFEAWCGEFDANLRRFEEGLARADAAGAAIVSFPECFLTGYPDTEELARAGAFAADSPQMQRVLDATSRHEALAIVGFNEQRGDDLYNTALVAHRGHLLGTYSKCAAYQKFHRQGRDFPVWEHRGLKFGVLICADGGYIEPARILALKGARVIFAPHFNYIRDTGLISHFMKVRADHAARAIENCASITASWGGSAATARAIRWSCASPWPACKAAKAPGTNAVMSSDCRPAAWHAAENSWAMEAMEGSKVATSATRLPACSASSNMASLGLSIGRATAWRAASMAAPKAEQVKSTASAPASWA